jgi:DNA (cytosine-5)-methyltransferase 1
VAQGRGVAMRALDLCAGAGGLSLGLSRAGFDALGVELDGDACTTHRRYVGPCVRADIREYHPKGSYDLVAGGVPCQSFSVAGKGLGTADPRGRLYLELLRVAVEADARAVLLENVRGIIRWLPEIIPAFEAKGYSMRWRLLDAADYGVPQHRKRVLLVGLRGELGFDFPKPSHGAPRNDRGLLAWVTVGEALGLVGEYQTGRLPGAKGWQGVRYLDTSRPAYTIGTRGNGDLLARLTEARLLDRPATTIAADPRLPAAGHDARQQAGAVRLSVEQCAILQGFPPGWTWTGNKSSQHRQVGNAVPPPLGEAIGRALLEALSARAEAA